MFLARVSGSVGFTAAARSVVVLARDPEDPEGETGSRRVIAHAKCNVGPLAPSLCARIEPRLVQADCGTNLETSRVVLLGETAQSARDLLEQPGSSEERSARDEAAGFLRAELANGLVPTRTLKAAASEAAGCHGARLSGPRSWSAQRQRKTLSAAGSGICPPPLPLRLRLAVLALFPL